MMSAEIMTRERKQSDDLTEKSDENDLIDHTVLAMTAIAGLLTMIYLQEPSL